MFPREWSKHEVVDINTISKTVENFWNELPK
jgi:hypothetical protein